MGKAHNKFVLRHKPVKWNIEYHLIYVYRLYNVSIWLQGDLRPKHTSFGY